MGRFRPKPYAQAFHEVVLDQAPEREEGVMEELDRLAQALALVPELRRVFETPMVGPERKTAILDQVLDALGIEEPTRRFAHVLQRQYRILYADKILGAYRDRVDRRHGRVRARVEVVGALTEAERRRIVDALARMTRARVVADFEDNRTLLAGFRATVGSTVFDGSLIGQLEQLGREMEA